MLKLACMLRIGDQIDYCTVVRVWRNKPAAAFYRSVSVHLGGNEQQPFRTYRWWQPVWVTAYRPPSLELLEYLGIPRTPENLILDVVVQYCVGNASWADLNAAVQAVKPEGEGDDA